jgi:hypothetical protein
MKKKDEWEIKFDALSDRAIARLREIATLSPMARVEVLFSHRIVHVSDNGTLADQSSVFPTTVALAIHLAKSDIEPTTASLSIVNSVDTAPDRILELTRLIQEMGKVAEVATADRELADIGIALQRMEIERRAEFLRHETERNEMILRLRDRKVRKTATQFAQLDEERQRAVLRLAKVDVRIRDEA